MKLPTKGQNLMLLIVALAGGILISLATGLVENPPEASIIGARYYGYPLVWRIVMSTVDNATDFRFANLAMDAAFWSAVSFVALFVTKRNGFRELEAYLKHENLLLPLILFIPLGLVMDLVHEFGHAVWGTAVGGHLAYMQVAYFVIYPRLAITSHFQLGLVRVDGLTTDFARGVMLIGGSMTTNIVSWLLALILLKATLGHKTQIALKTLGIIGLLDLPFYVFLPQTGLSHWVRSKGNGYPRFSLLRNGCPHNFWVSLPLLQSPPREG
jgi:hypothetical protein